MSTISLRIASASRPRPRPRAAPSVGETPNRHRPARGLLIGMVAGAGLWIALLTGLGIL